MAAALHLWATRIATLSGGSRPPPPRASPTRAPAWSVRWIGLASGELRREAMVSTRHYMIYGYSDFDVPPGIAPPVDVTPPGFPPVTPAVPSLATPVMTR